jgi:pilus assembly protein Flp/PilA
MNMRAAFQNFLRDQRAATAIEYGLIASLIAVALIVILTNVGTRMSGVYSEISAVMK